MRQFVLCGIAAVACFLCLAGDAAAGPVRNAIANAQQHRAERKAQRTCNECQPAVAQPTTGVHAARPTTLTSPGDCPGGKCPAAAPAATRGVFGLRK